MKTDTQKKIDVIKTWLGTGSINFFGRQYSGKDTQCELFAKALDGVVIGGGDILRSGDTPKEVMDVVNTGEFSPTDAYRAIVTPYLAKSEFASIPLMLSTVGRMKGEEEVVIKAAKASGHDIKAVVVLNIDEATTWQRFTQGRVDGTREDRDDDDKKAIERRLELYNENTMKVIDVYRKLGLVIDIDGTQPIDTVFEDIVNKLYDLTQTQEV